MMRSLDGTAPMDGADGGGAESVQFRSLAAPQAQQPPAYRSLGAAPQPAFRGLGAAQQPAYRSLGAPTAPAPPAAPSASAASSVSLSECAEKLSPERMAILHEAIDRLSRGS